MKVLMIFIDGFGLGEQGEYNPYFFARTPFFDSILGGHNLYENSGLLRGKEAIMIPIDACLGVPGVPQSATGQTTLWTGINAAQEVGRHVNAYPTRQLREIISNHSIMKVLADRGKKVTFANAYRGEYLQLVQQRKAFYSTSTLVTFSSGQPLRNIEDINRDHAVYHDFTNRMLIDWGYAVKEISPEQAGKNLARLAGQHDFTLYEYFISDKVGHARDMVRGIQVYEMLDRMIGACIADSNLEDSMIMIVSDHGNLEDLSCKGHTVNKVPTIIIHNNYERQNWDRISSLTDMTPFVLDFLCSGM